MKNQIDITEHLGLVRSIAKEYCWSKTMTYDDLCQEGVLGLITAANKYEESKGYKFSTYATFWIAQAISRAVYRESGLPYNLAEKVPRVLRAKRQLEEEGQPETLDNIVKKTQLPRKSVAIILESLGTVHLEALTAAASNTVGGGEIAGELIANSQQSIEDQCINGVAVAECIDNAMRSSLTKNEHYVITRRFLRPNAPQPTLDEVGLDMNLTRERVRQIEAKALKKLRKNPELLAFVNEE